MKNPLSGMGRLVSLDSRNWEYPLTAPPAPRSRTFRSWLVPGAPMDQGSTPHCVAYAGLHLLVAHPISNVQINAHDLYRDCQRNDQWPGENYDGTSILGLMRVLKRRGYVREYRWAWQVQPVIEHVLHAGPVVVGTQWTMDMMMADAHGYIRPTGASMGGHAYLLSAVNAVAANPDGTSGRFSVLNSWGNWERRGRAFITFRDMEALIRDGGEAAAPVEVRGPA